MASSILSNSLERRLVKVEQELTSYKATQRYGSGQIKGRLSYSTSIRSKKDEWNWEKITVKITFVGAIPDKVARGTLSQETVLDDSSYEDDFLYEIARIASIDRKPNVLEWIAELDVARVPIPPTTEVTTSCPFTTIFIVNANMSGSVTYADL